MTLNEFTESIGSKERAVIDFSASWCGPCQALSPEIEKLKAEYEGRVHVEKVDVDSAQEVAAHFGVQSVPTILFFENGEVKDRILGNQPDAIRSRTEALIR